MVYCPSSRLRKFRLGNIVFITRLFVFFDLVKMYAYVSEGYQWFDTQSLLGVGGRIPYAVRSIPFHRLRCALAMTSSQSGEETPLLPSRKRTPLPWFQFSIILFLQLAEPLTSQVIYPFAPQVRSPYFFFVSLFYLVMSCCLAYTRYWHNSWRWGARWLLCWNHGLRPLPSILLYRLIHCCSIL